MKLEFFLELFGEGFDGNFKFLYELWCGILEFFIISGVRVACWP